MTVGEILQYATIITSGAALFSVGFAVFSHRRQVNAEIYLDLSDRLHKAFRAIPIERHVPGAGDQKAHELEEARSRIRSTCTAILREVFGPNSRRKRSEGLGSTSSERTGRRFAPSSMEVPHSSPSSTRFKVQVR